MNDPIDYEIIARRLHSMFGILAHIAEIDPYDIRIEAFANQEMVKIYNLGETFVEIEKILYPNGFGAEYTPVQTTH